MRNSLFDVVVSVGDLHFSVSGYYRPGRPGRYSGPPESCYPDEPDEIEIDFVTLDEEGFAILPQELLEAVYVGEVKKIPGLDGKLKEVKMAGPTLADAIMSAVRERLAEYRREAGAADHGD